MAGCCNPGNPVGHTNPLPKPNLRAPGYELRGGQAAVKGKEWEKPMFPVKETESKVKLYTGV
jgi:hypothetical protein